MSITWTKDIYRQYSIGDYTYGKPLILDYKHPDVSLTIGKFCAISEGVTILLAGEHDTRRISSYPFERFLPPEGKKGDNAHLTKGPVVIGNDVWIGRGVTILSGAKIGDGAVIGAGSTVRGEVPPYVVVGGSPSVFLRWRFTEHDIERLLELQWWHWPITLIRECRHLLMSRDIDALWEYALEGMK